MVRKFVQNVKVPKQYTDQPSHATEDASTIRSASLEKGNGNAKVVVIKPKRRFRRILGGFRKPVSKTFTKEEALSGVHYVQSDEDLERLIEHSRQSSTKLFVEFGASWCEHCKSMIPTMMEIGRKCSKHKFAVADVFNTPRMSKDVVYTPTFWFYSNGLKVDQVVGSNKTSLKDRIWLHMSQ